MSQWLGKPRIDKDDIKQAQPSFVEFFPMLTRYYVDNSKMRVSLAIPHEMRDQLVAAVAKTYGSFNPTFLRKAALEAVEQWLKSHS